MIERIPAWQCIGCGKIDAPRPCIGVCQDRKVELVAASDVDQLEARLKSLESLVGLLAHTTPRAGEFEATYRLLQERARALLAS